MSLALAVDEFEQIIRHKSVQELVPFLLALEKKDVVAVREKTRTLNKELSENRQLGAVTWGSTGTNSQLEMLFFAGLGTYSSKEALTTPFANQLTMLNPTLLFHGGEGYLPHDARLAIVHNLFAHQKPNWLEIWLGDNTQNRFLQPLDFEVLLGFEQSGFLIPSPRFVAASACEALIKYGTEASMLRQFSSYENNQVALTSEQKLSFNEIKSRFNNLLQTEAESLPSFEDLIYQRIVDSPVFVERAIPSFFDFDVNLDTVVSMTVERKVWTRVTWREIILRLVSSGYHLDRADILTRCLLALRRDFRRPLLTWFKNLFLALQPSLAERLALQAELLELLPHAQPLVVNFALEQVKDMLSEPEFALAPLLLFADNLLIRPDLKTGMRTLLAALLKLPKQNAAHAPAVAQLLAAALPHPDGLVQERAAKGLAGLLAAPKPLLNAEESAAAVAAIAYHADLLGAPARTALAAWLTTWEPIDEAAETAVYAPAGQYIPKLTPATAIVPVADWHELLFLTGQVLQHRDPAATERWLDGLLRLNVQWPAAFAEQLRPYLAQLFPEIKKASEAEVAAMLREPVHVYGHAGMVQALLLTWATDFTVARVESADLKSPHVIPHPLLAIEKQRYLVAESLLRDRRALPLLSTPTHQPHWVAPSALVARLLAYQAAGLPPAPADLAVALARTPHAHPSETAEALRQLPALADAGLRALLQWFLGPANQPLPALPRAADQRLPASLQTAVAEAMPELWAVAARTKLPAGSFPALPVALGYDYSGVAQPLRSAFAVVQRENQYPDPERPGHIRTHRFVELAWDSGAPEAPPSPLLLYTPPVGKSQHGSWEQNSVMADDLPFLLALVPQHATPLYDQVLRSAAWADNLEATERDVVALALRALLIPGPALGTAETALLASGLIHHTPLCRSLAQEVLLRAVAEGRLLPAVLGRILGQQLAIGYAPVPRLATGLATLLAVDAVTDDALRQVLDALLPEMPAEAPRNTRQLLEAYAGLRDRTHRELPASSRTRLQTWQKSASLKVAVSHLLA
ncbi:MAG TPA: DUF6493 family protein [Hymenobacter sp.]|jgi:hypothetical protein|uniref:DUF6493 family protein n=1 Tax=Hymenobacter sp. TaxID=1898978 RepID=UPI002ED99E13